MASAVWQVAVGNDETSLPIVALLLCSLIWRTGEIILGNVAAKIILFGSALLIIFLEYSEIDRFTQRCISTASGPKECRPPLCAPAVWSFTFSAVED
jgi:hypothetical protein